MTIASDFIKSQKNPLVKQAYSVTISGNPGVGNVLTVAIPPNITSPSIQWQRYVSNAWVNILGATGTSYTQTSLDGFPLRCLVTNAQTNSILVTPSLWLIPSLFFKLSPAPANGTVVGIIQPPAGPAPSDTVYSWSGDTAGLSLDPATGTITVTDGTQITYTSGQKTRLCYVTAASASAGTAFCIVVINLRSGGYLTSSGSLKRRPAASGSRLCQGAQSTYTNGVYFMAMEAFDWDCYNGLTFLFCNHTNELTTGLNAITISASVNYPAGSSNWYPILFSGSASTTLAVGANIESDALTISGANPLPAGSKYIVRTQVHGTSWPLLDQRVLRASRGEGAVLSNSDLSTQTYITNDSLTCYGPSAVYTQSYAPVSFLLLGDSHVNGISYNGDNSLSSWVSMVLHGRVPYLNFSTYGENAYNWSLNHAKRLALIAKCGCSDAIYSYGCNDFALGYSLAQTQGAAVVTASLLYSKGIRVHGAKVFSRTSSTNQWADAAGQTVPTVFSPGGIADQYNTWLDTLPQFFTDIIDPRSGFQDITTNKILTDGTANKYTPPSDGVHQTIYSQTKIAKQIDPDSFVSPTIWVPTLPSLITSATAIFDADSLSGNDGDRVLSWADTVAAMTATATNDTTAPTLAKAVVNGHNAVRFTAANNQRMAVPAAQATAITDLFAGGGFFMGVYSVVSNVGFLATKGKSANGQWDFTSFLSFSSGNGTRLIIGRNGNYNNAAYFINGLATSTWHTLGWAFDTADYTQATLWSSNSFPNVRTANPAGSGSHASDSASNLILGNSYENNNAMDGWAAWIGFWQTRPSVSAINEGYAWARERFGTQNA